MMKKTTSLNVSTGPGCSYSFLHLTLEEYLTALHIAKNPSDFEMLGWIEKEDDVVLRFLAGMCRHDEYHSHPVYQELVQELFSNPRNGLQLIHCAYEYPSIMDSVKVDYSKHDTIKILPRVDFDWYVTGYCISHFDEQWSLFMFIVNDEQMDLFLKGLRSSTAKGRIRYLYLHTEFPFFLPLREFCQLHSLDLSYFRINHDDEVIIQQLIAPGSGLRRLKYNSQHNIHNSYTDTFIPLLFQQSSLEELKLDVHDVIMRTGLLPHSNTNLKKLIFSSNLIHLLAALITNIVSLTHLQISDPLDSDLPVLTNIVQSHHTLEVLKIRKIQDCDASTDTSTNMLQLIEAAGNSQLMEVRLYVSDYNKLPPHIHNLYKHLLVKSRY